MQSSWHEQTVYFFSSFSFILFIYMQRKTLSIRVHILLEFIYVHFFGLVASLLLSLVYFICMKINKMAGC